MDNLREGMMRMKDFSALRRLCERAFVADPQRTYADLGAMGLRDFANELRVDHTVGRLQENLSTLEPAPADSGS